ncbi:MAG: TonB-dependent receptor [Caulobacteraceae bacterium]
MASTVIVCAFAFATGGQAAAQAVQTAQAGGGSQPAAPTGGTDATAPTAAPAAVKEVVVTGSRIPQPGLTSTSPVTVVNDQEIKLEGVTDTIDLLNQLPQTNGNFGNQANPLSSESGISTVNLRGLGASRTLVLQDGKRLGPGDPNIGGASDIDQVPVELIDRVEVVTGGASAAYGSDAIAGVVNFIMKHDFQGVQLNVQGGFDQHDNHNSLTEGLEKEAGFPSPSGSVVDGQSWNASAIFGANTADGKGNVEGFVSYHHLAPVTDGSRDFSGCQIKATPANVPSCSGSATSNTFQDANLTAGPNGGPAPNAGKEFSVLGNQFVPLGTPGTVPGEFFNSSPFEYLQRQDERYQAAAFAHYQIDPKVEIYNDFDFMDDRTASFIAPSGAFLGSTVSPGNTNNALNVNCNNPLLSAQQVNTICTQDGLGPNSTASVSIGRRNVEGGGRFTTSEHESFRDVIGLRGDLDDAWHYDGYVQYSRVNFSSVQGGYLSNSRMSNALDVVSGPNGPMCASAVAVSQGCVPYNIFQQGGVTQAALNYLTESGQEQGFTQEQVAHFDITGQLEKYGIKSPFADRGVGINVGTEYRREQLGVSPAETLQGNDLAGGSGSQLPVNGSFDVYEVFGEVIVPIASNQPWIKDLSFDGGYRFSDYSSVGNTESYKASLEYAPTRDIRFRGSFQRALRAPNVNELFTASTATQASDLTADPCAAIGSTGNVATASLAQCLNTHVTAAQYGNGIAAGTVNAAGVQGTNTITQCPAQQCGALVGGNAKLAPETSDTVSFGGVFTPRWVPGLSFSVDYYNITVKNLIGNIPGNTTVQQCLTSGSPFFCNLIQRTPSGGLFGDASLATAGFANEALVNTGFLKTSGIDFEGNYRIRLNDMPYLSNFGNIGALNFNYNGNYTAHYIVSPVAGQGSYDCAGLYGPTCSNATGGGNTGGANPRFTNKLRMTYQSPYSWLVSMQWRYISAQKYEGSVANPLLSDEGPSPFDAQRSGISYIDLSASWQIKENLTLRASVNNVFDQDPPIVSSAAIPAGSPNAYSNYDLLGRVFSFGLTADF